MKIWVHTFGLLIYLSLSPLLFCICLLIGSGWPDWLLLLQFACIAWRFSTLIESQTSLKRKKIKLFLWFDGFSGVVNWIWFCLTLISCWDLRILHRVEEEWVAQRPPPELQPLPLQQLLVVKEVALSSPTLSQVSQCVHVASMTLPDWPCPLIQG